MLSGKLYLAIEADKVDWNLKSSFRRLLYFIMTKISLIFYYFYIFSIWKLLSYNIKTYLIQFFFIILIKEIKNLVFFPKFDKQFNFIYEKKRERKIYLLLFLYLLNSVLFSFSLLSICQCLYLFYIFIYIISNLFLKWLIKKYTIFWYKKLMIF